MNKKRKKKTEDNIILSEKNGVNPSILHCFICGKETGIALLGKLKGDVQAPKDMTRPGEFCEDCKKQIEAGNKFVLEVKEEAENPKRTGNYVCIKGSALPTIDSPVCYASQEIFQQMFNPKS